MDSKISSPSESNFENLQVLLADIPKHEEVDYQAIATAYWNVILIRLLIRFLLFGAILLTFLVNIDPLSIYLWPALIVYLVLTGVNIYWQRMAFPKRGFAVRTHDILYRRGVLSTLQTIIPFQRIQHVAVNESFLARRYGLAQLQIFTAGGASSDIKISGLLREDAERIKSLIMLHIVDIETPVDEQHAPAPPAGDENPKTDTHE